MGAPAGSPSNWMPDAETARPISALASRNVGRNGPPASLSTDPDVGVAAKVHRPVGQHVAGPRMDDCGVAKDSNFDIVSRQIRHLGRPCGLLEECGPVYDRPIRIRTAEITIKQNFVKMFDVGMQDRVDVFPIEPLEQKLRRQVGAVLRLIWQGFLLGAELAIS